METYSDKKRSYFNTHRAVLEIWLKHPLNFIKNNKVNKVVKTRVRANHLNATSNWEASLRNTGMVEADRFYKYGGWVTSGEYSFKIMPEDIVRIIVTVEKYDA